MRTVYQCTVCGRLTAGRLPRWGREVGDGTFMYPRRHRDRGKPCPGNIREAHWVEVADDLPVLGDPRPRQHNAMARK